MLMKIALAGATALAVAAAGPASAAAQTGADGTKLTIRAKVTPNKAGTKKKPRGVKLRVRANWKHPAGVERPVVARAETWFPRGSLYNGHRYPRCTKRTMDRQGTAGCPKRSIMGRAGGLAWADDVRTKPDIVIVNGGRRMVWLYTTLYRPALVREAVPMRVRRTRGRWAYKATIRVPRVLQVVAGVPVALARFNAVAGRGNWLATTFCPKSRRWRFKVRTHFMDGGSAQHSSSVRCRR